MSEQIPAEQLPSLAATAEQLASLISYFERQVHGWREMGAEPEDGWETIAFRVSDRFNLDTFMMLLRLCQQAVEARSK